MAFEIINLVRNADVNALGGKACSHILLLMADYASADTAQCFPGVLRLAHESGYSRSTVIAKLKWMCEHGLIYESAPPNRRQGLARVWTINVDRLKGLQNKFVRPSRPNARPKAGPNAGPGFSIKSGPTVSPKAGPNRSSNVPVQCSSRLGPTAASSGPNNAISGPAFDPQPLNIHHQNRHDNRDAAEDLDDIVGGNEPLSASQARKKISRMVEAMERGEEWALAPEIDGTIHALLFSAEYDAGEKSGNEVALANRGGELIHEYWMRLWLRSGRSWRAWPSLLGYPPDYHSLDTGSWKSEDALREIENTRNRLERQADERGIAYTPSWPDDMLRAEIENMDRAGRCDMEPMVEDDGDLLFLSEDGSDLLPAFEDG